MTTTAQSVLDFLETRASSTALTTEQFNALATDLRTQLNQLSVDVPGTAPDAITALYSGQLGSGVHTGALAEAFRQAHPDKVRTINKTELGQLLSLDRFDLALKAALGPAGEARNQLLDTLLNGSRDANGVQQPDSLWDNASHRFTAAAQGDIVTFTPNATADRVFGRTELDVALNSQAPTINGIPREDLLRLRNDANAAGLDGDKLVLDTVNGQSRVNLTTLEVTLDTDGKVTGVGTGSYFQALGLSQQGQNLPAGHAGHFASELFERTSAPSAAQVEAAANAKLGNDYLKQYAQETFNLAEAAGDAGKMAATASYLNKLGIAGDVLALTLAATAANAAYAAGDTAGAQQILSDWALDFAGGLAGGLLAAKLVGTALAPLYMAGPAGAILAGGLTLIAGLAGGIAGGQLAGDIASLFNSAKTWFPRGDPIILDLAGDGLETVGLASNIHFDHNGDGVLTKTGWVGANDALLVWDRNANGSIDTGAELFGDFTPLPNGTLAPNGFAALAALDSNGDGILDAADPAFAELKLWRDTDQNGVTGEGELISLTDAGIVSLNLAHSLKNQSLANGNTLAREGHFTRADGSTSAMGEFHLAVDTFDTRFAEQIAVPEELRQLPNMGGAGNVRELQQAAAQSGGVAGLLAQFQSAATRAEQKALLDNLLTAWAGTSGMAKSLEERAAGKNYIEYVAIGAERGSANLRLNDWGMMDTGGQMLPMVGAGSSRTVVTFHADSPAITERYRGLIAEWSRKLHVLEAFNGQYFFNLPETKSQTPSANWGISSVSSGSGGGTGGGGGGSMVGDLPGMMGLLRIQFSQGQLDLLQQAYDSLKESVYASLVMQTRLKPYLDQIQLVIDESGLRLDVAALNQTLADKRAADPENALADLLDLDRYAGNFLSGTNWQGLADFDQMIETLPQTAGITALLDEFKVRTLTGGDDFTSLTNKADIVLAGEGNDRLHGNDGNDRLFGQGGDDRLYGGSGDDLLSGGAGNDVLYGQAGADTYVFARGYGHDVILDRAENDIRRDTVRFLGLAPADIQVTADYADNLTFTVKDTGETLKVPYASEWWGQNGVGQYVFDDGTVWSHDDALRATVAATTENDDLIHGSSAGDAITGQAGNDTLIGNGGDDVIDGGAGNDLLIGSTGLNWIYENGSYRVERNTTPQISANGNDTYLFGRGDGQDTVIDGDYTTGNSDTLRFKEGVLPADVKLIRNGSDLVLAIRGTDDQVTLKQYFDEDWRGANGPWLIERIAFADGTVLAFADVQAILFAGSAEAETLIGSRGADRLMGLDRWKPLESRRWRDGSGCANDVVWRVAA